MRSRRRKDIKEKGDERILGDTGFVMAVLEETERRVKFQFSLSERIDQAKRLVDAECTKKGVHPVELRAGGRRRAISRLRASLAPVLIARLGLSQAEAGRMLGVSTSAVSRILERLKMS
jgi:CRP-like cAMP-binding protein